MSGCIGQTQDDVPPSTTSAPSPYRSGIDERKARVLSGDPLAVALEAGGDRRELVVDAKLDEVVIRRLTRR